MQTDLRVFVHLEDAQFALRAHGIDPKRHGIILGKEQGNDRTTKQRNNTMTHPILLFSAFNLQSLVLSFLFFALKVIICS
jgi:hypothetical protein